VICGLAVDLLAEGRATIRHSQVIAPKTDALLFKFWRLSDEAASKPRRSAHQGRTLISNLQHDAGHSRRRQDLLLHPASMAFSQIAAEVSNMSGDLAGEEICVCLISALR
jgi:hypothetical protein